MLRRALSTILAPVIIITAGLLAFFWLKAQDAPPERTRVPPSPPIVATIEFDAVEAGFDIHVGGNVVPSREVTISAQIAGAVVAKSNDVEGGRYVSQGTSLLQIDPASYELEVQSLGSELNQVAQDLRRAEVEAEGNAALIQIAESKRKLATQELKRVTSLFESNAVAETEVDEAQRFELEASNALRTLHNVRDLIPTRRTRLEAELKLVELRQQQAQLSLDRTRVVAPFDGIITNDAVELGDFVQPGDVLLEIEDTASIEVQCNLRTDDLYWLWNSHQPGPTEETGNNESSDRATFEVPRAPATVTYSVGGEEFHWQGELARFEGRGIDETTRTVPCRVIVSEPRRDEATDGPPALMRGMYVTITLPVSPRVRLWKIPNRAVQPNGQVWTIEGDELRIHEITPARVLPDSVLFRADATDLKVGDRIIVSQLATAFEGMQVRESDQAERSP
ncbi:MAG: hypothetical protein CMJ64_23770 [Planctomycetaceae bacterium]|nr:hypothetical protein [Planctomycetaceae bacterium]